MNKKRKQKQHTAMLIPVEVFQGQGYIGHGYFLLREDGVQSNVVMYDLNGNYLPEGSYGVTPCEMGQLLCVVPFKVQ